VIDHMKSSVLNLTNETQSVRRQSQSMEHRASRVCGNTDRVGQDAMDGEMVAENRRNAKRDVCHGWCEQKRQLLSGSKW